MWNLCQILISFKFYGMIVYCFLPCYITKYLYIMINRHICIFQIVHCRRPTNYLRPLKTPMSFSPTTYCFSSSPSPPFWSWPSSPWQRVCSAIIYACAGSWCGWMNRMMWRKEVVAMGRHLNYCLYNYIWNDRKNMDRNREAVKEWLDNSWSVTNSIEIV